MKSGKPLITFVIVLLAAAMLLYMAFHAWTTFQDPFTTTYAYQYQRNDSIEVDGLVVRQETVLPGGQGILEVTRGEGEQVGVGQQVAQVYRDGEAQQAQLQQDALRMEMTQLQYAIGQGGDVGSVAKVDEEILQAMVRLRSSCALSDYSDLEDQVLQVKSSLLRREYAYGANLTSEDLVARLNDLKGQYTALQGQTYAAVTQITAPVSGSFSSLVDGYETLIDPESVLQLTPEGLEGLLDQPPAAPQGTAGKLITKNRWYYAAVVTEEEAQRLQGAYSITLRFASDFVEEIPVRLEQIGPVVEGQAVAVVSTDRFLEQTTLLRRQAGELILGSETGIRVPKAALRMVTTTTTDPETEQTTQTQTVGVYVLTAGKAEFKAVKILAEGEDFYVVESINQEKKALRAGDEIIVQATDLYDGKLLQY